MVTKTILTQTFSLLEKILLMLIMAIFISKTCCFLQKKYVQMDI